MKADINQWIFKIPVEDIRTETYDEGKGENPCVCCGKDVKTPKYWVHMLTSGNLVSTDEPFAEQEDMGMFPIGNSCKNKLPNNFYFKG
jgi:tRNA U34 2-thiouridine synthase MnmA/TrmU